MTSRLASGHAADTIFALASGAGRSAIAVVRLSGSASGRIVTEFCGRLPTPRRASVRRLHDDDGAVLDQAVVLWLPSPASYTGEDAAEFHLHGGPAVLQAVTAALVRAGARPSDPGEFTRRAVLNGKLDLLAAEAVGDLVDSETELQRSQAMRQLSGEQAEVVATWAAQLTRSLAWQEALIDFADDDLPASVEDDMLAELAMLRPQMQAHLGASQRGERLRRGLVFVISGSPNVGKSTLLNAVARRDAAIVSPLPGTTRDLVRVEIDLDGIPVTLVDTAGRRETDDPVEAEGVRRAQVQVEAADLVLEVIDAGICNECSPPGGSLQIFNKVDLGSAVPPGWLGVSARTGEGMPALLAALRHQAAALAHPGAAAAFGRARHVAALRDAISSLDAALSEHRPELRAEELRGALRALGRLTGEVASEAILDVVFGAFCIGK